MAVSGKGQRLARLEAVQNVVLDISRRSAHCNDLREFFGAVHAGVERIMYARSLYIALRDAQQDTIRYVYDVDERDIAQEPDKQLPLLSGNESPTAWVIRQGEPLSVKAEEFAARLAQGQDWGMGTDAEHWLGMPLIGSDGRTFGAVVIQSYTRGVRYTDEDTALLELISHHIAHAIEQVQFTNRLELAIAERTRSLEQEVAERRRGEQLQRALYEISAQSVRDIDLLTFYTELHRILGGLLYAKNLIIAHYEGEDDSVHFPYYADEKDTVPPGYRRSAGHGSTGFVLRTRHPQRIDQQRYQTLVKAGRIHHSIGSPDFNVWIGAPMIYQDKILGAVVLQSYDPTIGYDYEDLELLTFVADHIAAALSRKQADDELRAAHAHLAAGSAAMQAKNRELEKTLEDLGVAQSDLMRQEKLASLGALVAGIAHEVNTPLGICVTAVSHLAEEIQQVRRLFAEKHLTESGLQTFFESTDEILRILTSNTQRASGLIRSFKQVAVDRSSDDVRDIVLAETIDETLKSLHPKLKGTRHEIAVDCDPQLRVRTVPGALSQILTNLVINSIVHGFERIDEGRIRIDVHHDDATFTIHYQDDGAGMLPDALKHLFDPFYTTKRGQGGSGLGANIIYNLVTTKLGGSIAVESMVGDGLHYRIRLPLQPQRPATSIL